MSRRDADKGHQDAHESLAGRAVSREFPPLDPVTSRIDEAGDAVDTALNVQMHYPTKSAVGFSASGRGTQSHDVSLDWGVPSETQPKWRVRQRNQIVHPSEMQPVKDEHFVSWGQTPEQMDALWETGWRHFGPIFYRYRQCLTPAGIRNVQPLRIDVQKMELSKSQRRTLRKNADLELRVGPAELLEDRQRLFDLHKTRFIENVPNSLEDFLGPAPQAGPCLTVELGAFLGERLIAASYLDVGETTVSSVYGFFDPAESWRSLGNATLIWEILLARRTGKRWHYPGYAYLEPSGYDYKKRFAPMEYFDWQAWRTLPSDC